MSTAENLSTADIELDGQVTVDERISSIFHNSVGQPFTYLDLGRLIYPEDTSANLYSRSLNTFRYYRTLVEGSLLASGLELKETKVIRAYHGRPRMTLAFRAEPQPQIEQEVGELLQLPIRNKLSGFILQTMADNLIRVGSVIDETPDPTSVLTPRQIEVLEHRSRGLRREEVGELLGISVGTVGVHMDHIFSRLDIRGRGAANPIRTAWRWDLLGENLEVSTIRGLNAKQSDVLSLIASGYTIPEIRDLLGRNEDTVKSQVKFAKIALNTKNLARAVRVGLELGEISGLTPREYELLSASAMLVIGLSSQDALKTVSENEEIPDTLHVLHVLQTARKQEELLRPGLLPHRLALYLLDSGGQQLSLEEMAEAVGDGEEIEQVKQRIAKELYKGRVQIWLQEQGYILHKNKFGKHTAYKCLRSGEPIEWQRVQDQHELTREREISSEVRYEWRLHEREAKRLRDNQLRFVARALAQWTREDEKATQQEELQLSMQSRLDFASWQKEEKELALQPKKERLAALGDEVRVLTRAIEKIDKYLEKSDPMKDSKVPQLNPIVEHELSTRIKLLDVQLRAGVLVRDVRLNFSPAQITILKALEAGLTVRQVANRIRRPQSEVRNLIDSGYKQLAALAGAASNKRT